MSPSADAVLVEVDRVRVAVSVGDAVQGAVRPLLIVVCLVLAQGLSRCLELIIFYSA